LKKQIFIALSVLLLLSFTVLAYAEEPQIKLGGDILIRGFWFDNVDQSGSSPTFLPVQTPSQAFYTTEARLTVDAKVSDNLKGFMELETAFGGDPYSGEYYWGEYSYNAKPPADLLFRQLWIQYTGSGLLGIPSGMKVGHQLLTLGEKQFLNHERFGDDAIVLFIQPTKELFLAALTGKLAEGSLYSGPDDLDIYTILGTYKLDKDNTLGINYSYIGDSYIDLKLSNLGVHANGLIAGALTYAAEFDWQFGNTRLSHDDSTDKYNFKGYGFMAKAGYKIDPVNLRASFAWGSGDSDGLHDKDIDEFQVTMDSDNQYPETRFVHYTQIYERTVSTSALGQILGQGVVRGTGIANTVYYNLGVDLMAMKDLGLSLDGFLLRAAKTLTDGGQNKSIGVEVDFKGSYKLAKNLTYFVEAGFFDPGKYYSTGIYDGMDKETVTQLIHGLNLSF